MKKFIQLISVFVSFTIIVYLLLLILWGNYAHILLKKNLNYKLGSYGHMYTRLQEAQHTKDVDILFLGSSHCYRGFDTRIFKKANFNTFNLGSSAQSPIQTEVLLNRYLVQMNPKMVIYEVCPITLSSDGVESTLDILANNRIDWESIKMAISLNHIKIYNTLFYSLYKQVFNKNNSFHEDIIRDGDRYIKGGFVEKKLMYFQHKKHIANELMINEDQFHSFENILNELKKRNIRTILVQSPVTKSLYDSYTNKDYFENKLSAYGEYHNFNNLMILDDSLNFYDTDHLNQTGVELFNNKLLEILLAGK